MARVEKYPVRILHVIHSVNPQGGGPIEGIRQLIPALAVRGVETEVMSLDAPDAPWTTGFPVPLHALGPARFNYGYTARAVPWLRQHRSRYNAVIVNGLWQYGGFAVWRALRGTSTPYFVYPHGMLDPWFNRNYPLKHLKKLLYWPWGEYRVLRDASAVLFTAEQERLEARKSFQPYRCHEIVTGYGIAAPRGDLFAPCAAFLAQYPELQGQRLLLFLGRIHEKKGCDLLLRAWKDIVSRCESASESHLVMAGPAEHEYGAEMKALTRTLGLEGRVTWTGMLAGELKWGSLGMANAFILPSHQENFGISVVEALACGVPVLISNKVNIWREIEQDQAGLVDEDTLSGTTRLLERWLTLTPTDQEMKRRQAHLCFNNRFHVARTAEVLTSIFEA